MTDNRDNIPENKPDAEGIELAKNSKILSWLDNFWYHYKWTVIIVAFFVTVLVIGIVQIFSKTDADATLLFSGPVQMSDDEITAIRNDLGSLLPEDRNGDGEKYITFMEFAVFSEQEMEEENHKYKDDDGKYIQVVTPSHNASLSKEYQSYTQTGDCSIYFVSEHLYSNLVKTDRLVKLSEFFEQTPDGAIGDEYGIKLSETDLYEFFDSLKVLPEDTVICFVRPYMWGDSSNSENYDFAKEYFKAIAEFKAN